MELTSPPRVTGLSTPDPQSPPKFTLVRLVESCTHWFAAIAAITYGCGFLCIYTFLDRIGIREPNTEFFRVKYIHAGILFLLFPVSILGPSWVIVSISRDQRKQREQSNGRNPTRTSDSAESNEGAVLQPDSTGTLNTTTAGVDRPSQLNQVSRAHIVFYLNLCFFFYVFMLFTPRDFFFERQPYIFGVFIVSTAGPFFINRLMQKWVRPDLRTTATRRLLWALLVAIILPFDYLALFGFWPQLWRIFWGHNIDLSGISVFSRSLIPDGGFYYVVFLALIPLLEWRTNIRTRHAPTPKAKTEMRLSAHALAFMFLYIAINAFALKVYPYIPASKGGGFLKESPSVGFVFHTAFWKEREEEEAEADIVAKNGRFVLIEQSPNSFFVADRQDAGGPMKWAEMRELPRIFELRRDSVNQIIYTHVSDEPGPGTSNSNKKGAVSGPSTD